MEYSIVVPIFNDGYLAADLALEIQRVMSLHLQSASLSDEVELIFVNDGSANESLDELIALRNRFDFVRVIDLSRNFGQHQAIACGIREARGKIVVRMNVDMQDPPAAIPKLLTAMKETDSDLVVGQYSSRNSPFVDKITSYIFFAIFGFLTGYKIHSNTSPLRAMSRRYVDAYNRLTEKSRFPQGLDHWLGFKHQYVEIVHQKRADKRTSYTFFSRLRLAIDGVLYFSDRPLKFVALGGIALSFLGILLSIWIIAEKIFGDGLLPGYASLASISLIAFGVQLSCTGVLGLYIGKIFKEVQNRPLYLIRTIFDQFTAKSEDKSS